MLSKSLASLALVASIASASGEWTVGDVQHARSETDDIAEVRWALRAIGQRVLDSKSVEDLRENISDLVEEDDLREDAFQAMSALVRGEIREARDAGAFLRGIMRRTRLTFRQVGPLMLEGTLLVGATAALVAKPRQSRRPIAAGDRASIHRLPLPIARSLFAAERSWFAVCGLLELLIAKVPPMKLREAVLRKSLALELVRIWVEGTRGALHLLTMSLGGEGVDPALLEGLPRMTWEGVAELERADTLLWAKYMRAHGPAAANA